MSWENFSGSNNSIAGLYCDRDETVCQYSRHDEESPAGQVLLRLADLQICSRLRDEVRLDHCDSAAVPLLIHRVGPRTSYQILFAELHARRCGEAAVRFLIHRVGPQTSYPTLFAELHASRYGSAAVRFLIRRVGQRTYSQNRIEESFPPHSTSAARQG